MNASNLTTAERKQCQSFFDWLLDSIALVINTPKTETIRHRRVKHELFQKEFHRIWEFFRKTGMTDFVDVAEKFRQAWFSYSRLWQGPTPTKQLRSEWMGARLLVAYRIATLLHKGSGYAFISEQLENREASLDTDAIKMRVSSFKKRSGNAQFGNSTRELFEASRLSRVHKQKNKQMVSLRCAKLNGSYFLTSLTDRELKFLSKLTSSTSDEDTG